MALTRIGTSAYSTLDATKLAGNLPSISGASLTGISSGAVKQIVHTSQTGQLNTSSTSFVWSDITASISLTSTSNDVLCFVQFGGEYHSQKGSGGHFKLYYKEGSSESSGGTNFSGWSQVCTSTNYLVYGGSSDMNVGQGCFITKETRISNTNSHTFQVAFKTRSSDTFYPRHGNDTSTTVTLMEI